MGNGSGIDAARYSLDIISNKGAAFANETGDLIGAMYAIQPTNTQI